MRAKVRVNAMRDAVALSKDQERMRRRHDVTIKTSPPVYEPSIPAEEKDAPLQLFWKAATVG